MQELRGKYSTVVSERDNLAKTMQAMGDLSVQQVESEHVIRSVESELKATTLEKNKLQDQVEALNAQVIMIVTLCDGMWYGEGVGLGREEFRI